MRFHELVRTSASVAATRSRKEKVAHLAALLEALKSTEELDIAVPFLTGELRQGKIGVGWALVKEARSEPPARDASLTFESVDRTLEAVRATTGAGSKARRLGHLRELFALATADEQEFLAKLLVGELRLGALEGLLVESVAQASELPAARIRRAAMLGGSLQDVARAALRTGERGLERFRIEVLRALQPMLASTAKDASEVLERLGRAAFEWKLDGARIQVHKRGRDVRIFTRRLHDVTRAAPEVVELVRGFEADELILDGEVIALDEEARPQPFQTTMSRFGRQLDIEAQRLKTPLSSFFFDLLFLDGAEWIDRPGHERWAELERVVPDACRVRRAVIDDPSDAQAFYAEALDQGHEGLVAKALDRPYEAGRRGKHWLKLKPAHTLDLVVLAAEWGSGRRKGWLSNLHLGARDPEGGFVMLGKTFKGMTDATLERQTRELLALETHRENHVVHVSPERVVEVAFDGVQASPHYPGGVALRFARLKRYRDDKSAEQADTIDAVRALL